MSALQEISCTCPTCEREVMPVRRKLPSATVTTPGGSRKFAAPSISFGYFCPDDACRTRLDSVLENARSEAEPVEQANTIDHDKPTDEPTNVVPISDRRPIAAVVKPRAVASAPSEDLFARIRREHEEVRREEQELTTRLASVIERRKKLDLLVTAIDVAQEQNRAE